ncbi:putative regulator of chromosome condensation 1/beta-lactamase-inhibitor protein II [Helianthus anomalus]
MCEKRAIFKPMNLEKSEDLKLSCGGSWKLVLRFLLAGETCSRREKSEAIAGPGHSIVVTSKGSVYTFGSNSSGQLGHGTTEEVSRPRLIRSQFLIQ